jgi:hypothetical protein
MQPLGGIKLRRIQIEQERAARMASRTNHVSSSIKSGGTHLHSRANTEPSQHKYKAHTRSILAEF